MFSKNCIIPIMVLLFIFKTSFAQDVKVKDVRFEQKGEDIFVYYDLEGNFHKKYKVSLSLSDNFGSTFTIKPRSVRGDVGENMVAGNNKQIIWHMTKDFPEGLEGEGFVFGVEAEQTGGGSKSLYYILGAGVVGGVVYFITKSVKEESTSQETTGKITISIPGEI